MQQMNNMKFSSGSEKILSFSFFGIRITDIELNF